MNYLSLCWESSISILFVDFGWRNAISISSAPVLGVSFINSIPPFFRSDNDWNMSGTSNEQ